METKAVSEPDRVQMLMETLADCLAELDFIGAHVAGAHLDLALHALQRQFGLSDPISNTE